MNAAVVNLQRSALPRDLMQLQPLRWFSAVLGDWLLIIIYYATFAWLGKPFYAIPLAAFLIGSRQHALAILGHEGAHFLILRNRRWNDIAAQFLVSWPLLISIKDGYRPWHFNHHRDLGTNNDPELSYRDASIYHGNITWYRISLLFFADLCGFGLFDAIRFLGETFPYRRPLAYIGALVFWMLAIGAFHFAGMLWIPAIWLLSIATGFYAIFRIRTFTEHVGVPLAGKASSHRFVPGPLARFLLLPHNTWCHYEHHQWPQVPFYHIRQLRDLDQSKPIARMFDLFPWR